MQNLRKTYPSVTLAIVAVSFFYYASSGGITGKTPKNGNGCTCHGSSAAAVTVSINGPATLTPGETADYSITISGGPLTRGGTNIAASAGTLVNASTDLRVASGELTHTAPKAPAGGTVTFNFKYTAPATAGDITLYASGNSVNNNGSSNGDQWNFAANKVIAVSAATGLEDENLLLGFSLAQNYPNPFNPSTIINYHLTINNFVTLKVYDISGKEVAALVNGMQEAGMHSVTFNSADYGLTSGVYLYELKASPSTGSGTSPSAGSGTVTMVKKMILSK